MTDTASTDTASADTDTIAPEERRARHLACLETLYRGLAHDAKGPMNAITLNLELLRATAARSGDGSSQRWLSVVETELRRLDAYVAAALKQLAPLADSRTVVDLGDLVSDVVQLVEAEARHRRITFEHGEHSGGPARVELRADRVRQALLWLVTDILSRLDEGDSLTLRTACAEGEASFVVGTSRELEDLDDLARRAIAIEEGSVDLVDLTSSEGHAAVVRFETRS